MSIHVLIIDVASDEVGSGVESGSPYLQQVATHLNSEVVMEGGASDHMVTFGNGRKGRHLHFQDLNVSCPDLLVIIEGIKSFDEMDKLMAEYIPQIVDLYDLDRYHSPFTIKYKDIGEKHVVVFESIAEYVTSVVIAGTRPSSATIH